jgi:type I restriction enzyme S subunit
MSYEKTRLKEITNIRTGKLDSNAAVANGLYPFFTCDPSTLRINTWAYDTEAVLLAGNNASGNYTAKYYNGQFNAYQRTYIIESVDKDILDVRYLSYAMNQELKLLKTMSAGSTTKFLKIGMLHGLEISLPEISIQRKIANILGTYDKLIESNHKQIKLLEEAAQRLYKEWFVDLRFPGYEDVEIIDGVPDGWKKGTLGNIADNVGKTEKKEKRDNYAYYLPIDCLPKKSLAYTDFNDIALAESSLIAFKANDILFGAMRPYFHKVVIARDEGLTRSTCFVINSKQDYMWSYLTMLLFSVDTINYATRISVGTTMPYVRWKDFVQMPVLIPNENVAIAFKKQFMSIADKITKLAKQNIYLSQARDRLLPKLMNGEIEV